MVNYCAFSDLELAKNLQKGDPAAFTEIYERYSGLLFIHAFKLLHSKDDAQDVVQEIFTNLWDKATHLPLDIPIRKYLYRALKNRILNFFEHQRICTAYIELFHTIANEGEWLTDEKLREKEVLTVLRKEIAALPPKMREVFERSRIRYQPHKKIALDLGISDKTVKKQISNAIKIIKTRMEFISICLCFFWF